ncbi:MAG: S-methyl-5'-thioadenosine phosphorylase [Thermoplasmata archaeon]|nr:S-methyl-5'-thioadenosine phosphorylase [Thermoplasmata archaeon]
MIGVIGGSGLYKSLKGLEKPRDVVKQTPYGQVIVTAGYFSGKEIVFLSRHGKIKQVPPHRINHRANIYALKKSGVEKIIAVSAVGGINTEMPPGFFVLPSQYIDFTREVHTFYDEEIKHVDMTEPFSAELRKCIGNVLEELKFQHVDHGVYVCMPGPQFETPAEIKMLSTIGGDIVGMTVVPEAKLAREMGITYQPLCMVVNWAAGISAEQITHETTLRVVAEMNDKLTAVLQKAIERIEA